MEIIKTFNRTELSKLEKISYGRTIADKDLYIPVKILTAQSRATNRGYTIRYIRRKDIVRYLLDNPVKNKPVNNDNKYKKVKKVLQK